VKDDAGAEQVESGAPVHLAFEHLDLVDGALDLAGAVGQGEAVVAALLAYLAALRLGGSGFIAAFTGGMTFGYFSRRHDLPVTVFNEDVGGTLAGATWVGFGALAVGQLLPHVTWQIVAYAALSLTLIRMVPVAIALLGTGARLPTVAFMGWFGPRGLASIVFALIAFESHIPNSQMLFTTVMMIILLSVFLHGLSSVPLVASYSRWYAAHVEKQPSASEAKPTIMSRLRQHQAPEEQHPTPEETEPATARQRPSQ
jgi:sodium/hydrogen antiporter